jgi:hypothetical protein
MILFWEYWSIVSFGVYEKIIFYTRKSVLVIIHWPVIASPSVISIYTRLLHLMLPWCFNHLITACYDPILRIFVNSIVKEKILFYTRKSVLVIVHWPAIASYSTVSIYNSLLHFYASITLQSPDNSSLRSYFKNIRGNSVVSEKILSLHTRKSVLVIIHWTMWSSSVISIYSRLLHFYASMTLQSPNNSLL